MKNRQSVDKEKAALHTRLIVERWCTYKKPFLFAKAHAAHLEDSPEPHLLGASPGSWHQAQLGASVKCRRSAAEVSSGTTASHRSGAVRRTGVRAQADGGGVTPASARQGVGGGGEDAGAEPLQVAAPGLRRARAARRTGASPGEQPRTGDGEGVEEVEKLNSGDAENRRSGGPACLRGGVVATSLQIDTMHKKKIEIDGKYHICPD